MRRYKLRPKVLGMRCVFPLLLPAALLLTGCKDAQAGQASTSPVSRTPSPPVRTDPDVRAAQTAVNQINQGRACTTFTRSRLESTIDTVRPEYAKRQVLIKHGLVSVRHVKDKVGQLDWEVYTNADLDEADGKGVFIQDGRLTFYCFGRWVVTEAAPSDKFPADEGQRLLLTTLVLRDAPEWMTTDPAAKVLAGPSTPDDPAYFGAINQYDKFIAPSLTGPNRVPVLVPRE